MQDINAPILNIEHDRIKRTVHSFDPNAQVYLFGPGTTNPGQAIDLYIKSKLIDADTRAAIKERLNRQLFMHHVEMVCGVKEYSKEIQLRVLGVEI